MLSEKILMSGYNFEQFSREDARRFRFSSKPFDRNTFDPINNLKDAATLGRLRGPGNSRWWRQGWEKWLGNISSKRTTSPAYESALYFLQMKDEDIAGKILVDAGCGDSGDADMFSNHGGLSVGYDLFPRKTEHTFPELEWSNRKEYILKRSSDFKIQDICTHWEKENESVDVIISNAVLDLLTESERNMFYQECKRVLKKSGALSICLIHLKNGHGFTLENEKIRMEKIGLKVSMVGSAIIAFK